MDRARTARTKRLRCKAAPAKWKSSIMSASRRDAPSDTATGSKSAVKWSTTLEGRRWFTGRITTPRIIIRADSFACGGGCTRSGHLVMRFRGGQVQQLRDRDETIALAFEGIDN